MTANTGGTESPQGVPITDLIEEIEKAQQAISSVVELVKKMNQDSLIAGHTTIGPRPRPQPYEEKCELNLFRVSELLEAFSDLSEMLGSMVTVFGSLDPEQRL